MGNFSEVAFFDKHFKNDDYTLLFNTETGLEILQGNDGKGDPFVLELPSLLDIGIMGSCHNKCKICYQGHTDKPNMMLDHFKKIIDSVKHHVNQVALGGRGDPNKHEHFKEIVEYCRRSNVVPNYTTSGFKLTPEEVEISKMCGAVAVSAYGTEHTRKAIDLFTTHGIKTNIHYVFSRDSYENIIRLLRGINIWDIINIDLSKINAIIFLLFKPQGAAINMKELTPTMAQLQSFSHLIFNSTTQFKVGMDSCLVNHVLRYHTPTQIERMSLDTCEGARMSAYISPDMKFMPCSFANEHEWSVQISNEYPLTSIWKGSNCFDHFRAALKMEPNRCPLHL